MRRSQVVKTQSFDLYMRRFDPYRLSHAVIAQLAEQARCKRQVVGSSPTGSSSPPRAIFFTQGDNIRSPGASPPRADRLLVERAKAVYVGLV